MIDDAYDAYELLRSKFETKRKELLAALEARDAARADVDSKNEALVVYLGKTLGLEESLVEARALLESFCDGGNPLEGARAWLDANPEVKP